MAIKFTFKGFDNLLEDIKRADGDIDKACDSAIRQGAQIMQSELKTEMRNAKVSKALINRMPQFEVEKLGNKFTAKVGYKPTEYDEKNPSDYFKAIFINYGTPRRTKHGKVKARGFIQKAKRRAKPKIKKQQEEAFKKILARLKK